MQNLAISTSFVQDRAHVSKSERFVAIQPSQISEVLADHGLFLNHLKTAAARNPERANHQTSIARYVATDSADIVSTIGQGSSLDLLVRAPHLTGSVEFRLGFFRGVCANQWNAGKLFANVKVRHTGNCLEEINRLIPSLVAHREELIGSIRAMQARQVSSTELVSLATEVAHIRLGDVANVERTRVGDLLRIHRAADAQSDLFSVANVLQENALRYGIRYELRTENERGQATTRNMNTRPIIETTASAVEMTGSIWEAAAKLLA